MWAASLSIDRFLLWKVGRYSLMFPVFRKIANRGSCSFIRKNFSDLSANLSVQFSAYRFLFSVRFQCVLKDIPLIGFPDGGSGNFDTLTSSTFTRSDILGMQYHLRRIFFVSGSLGKMSRILTISHTDLLGNL